MDDVKRAKRTKKNADVGRTARQERRFLPSRSALGIVALVAGGIGAALLGAGVYAHFIRETPLPFGSYLVGAGALLLAAVILVSPDPPRPLLIGDGGVGFEQDEGPARLLWCDVSRVALEGSAVVIQGRDTKLSVPWSLYPEAAGVVIREAEDRIPARVAVTSEERGDVPPAVPEAGEQRALEDPQVAGRRCRKSDRVISYEPDARLCLRCGEVYHKDSVPERCLTCEGDLGEVYRLAEG